jgi:hypothetical protein
MFSGAATASCANVGKHAIRRLKAGWTKMIDRRQSWRSSALDSVRRMVIPGAQLSASALAGLLLASAISPVWAESPHGQATATENQTLAGGGPAKGAHEAAPHFSKLEARRIRHVCFGRANEQGLRGAERSAFLSHCYFGRVSHRGVRHACRKEGSAKGLDRSALRDFVRECVKERTTQKNQKEESAPTKGL